MVENHAQQKKKFLHPINSHNIMFILCMFNLSGFLHLLANKYGIHYTQYVSGPMPQCIYTGWGSTLVHYDKKLGQFSPPVSVVKRRSHTKLGHREREREREREGGGGREIHVWYLAELILRQPYFPPRLQEKSRPF